IQQSTPNQYGERIYQNTSGSGIWSQALDIRSYTNGSGGANPAGIYVDVQNYNTGSTHLQGIGAQAFNQAGTAGTITALYVLTGNFTSTATTAQGIFVDASQGSGITNQYGIYLGNQASGTNNWSIYSNGGKSYFKDSVGIGIATPTVALDVNGTG